MTIPQLSRQARAQATEFIKAHGRPLERALYAVTFEGERAEAAIDELAHFQNADGGFGHGLEPDIRLPGSSVIATTVAFQRLRDLRVAQDHPLVSRACAYLLQKYEAAQMNWPNIPTTVDDAPHAPWWQPTGDLSENLANPRAEILGYWYEYPSHVPDDLRQSLTNSVMAHLTAHPDQMEMHDLLCYLRLWQTPGLPDALTAAMRDKLTRIALHTVERDPAAWRGYGLQPIAVASTPRAPLAATFAADLPANLAFLVEQLEASGYLQPAWSWGDLWPEAWAQAQREWSGVLTLNALKTLHEFGYLQ
jgi:hypothetical protein